MPRIRFMRRLGRGHMQAKIVCEALPTELQYTILLLGPENLKKISWEGSLRVLGLAGGYTLGQLQSDQKLGRFFHETFGVGGGGGLLHLHFSCDS